MPQPLELNNTQKLTILAQDPSLRRADGRILTSSVEIPAEALAPGPCGYRVKVVDYDASADRLYTAPAYRRNGDGRVHDPFALAGIRDAKRHNAKLLGDPKFHAQNVYAICMRILARFEFALGRRVCWGSDGHQLHVVPHAFADANAFYSEDDRALLFGYFRSRKAPGAPVFTCLSHDVVAHEATHAILDGLRDRYTEPSSPDQAAFHEGFADVVALLSVFALPEVVAELLAPAGRGGRGVIGAARLTPKALKKSALLGLADQLGQEIAEVRGGALRQSAEMTPSPRYYLDDPEFKEPHRRGEILVAAMMNSFIEMWTQRIKKLGSVGRGRKDRSRVVEDGAKAADHLLTMAIRAIDYCPATDVDFPAYLSALLTADHETAPDDTRFGYREMLLKNFEAFGIVPPSGTDEDGNRRRFTRELVYTRTHFDSLQRDPDEAFRFIWENRAALGLADRAYTVVEGVRPSIRVGPDGFVLRETMVHYVQMETLRLREMKAAYGIRLPRGAPSSARVRLYGSGALIFDEHGRVKYHIAHPIDDARRQSDRLKFMHEAGYFEQLPQKRLQFARMHVARAVGGPSEPRARNGAARAGRPPAAKVSGTPPTKLAIRAYQVGFGDCFLLSFAYPGGKPAERHVLIDFGSTGLPKKADKGLMLKVANDINARTGGNDRTNGKLHAIVATHRHKDHISGFDPGKDGKGPGAVIRSLKPDCVVQPWTEHPDLKKDAQELIVPKALRAGGQSFAHVSTLAAMHEVADCTLAELRGLRRALPVSVRDQLGFIGEDNLSNLGAVRNLIEMGKKGDARYVHYNAPSGLERVLPGVAVRVLGPPTVAQHNKIKKQTSKHDEFWTLRRLAMRLNGALGGKPVTLFPSRHHWRGKIPGEAAWLVGRARRLRGEMLLGLVRTLDDAMNNTSLILLFEVGGKRLLFPGDAQIENWEFALSQKGVRELLAGVNVYKVGHHGSLNATPKSVWEGFWNRSSNRASKSRLKTLLSTMAGKHGHEESDTEVPRRTLLKALKEKSELCSTQEIGPQDFFRDVEIPLQ